MIGARLLFGKRNGALGDRDSLGIFSNFVQLFYSGVKGVDSVFRSRGRGADMHNQ